ncbi:hypothetical protein JMJ77_0006986 [Colletotrichum scovillei]|uniref:Uncharacterized protein n=1 Tax=Colletotrichum scovillei TaxID=1209932 RepID=A0A9P7UG28_9PEZI|nr:hypothetical protein JMJ77_0006986 [Colletotrichum scovillei]KAG7073950.1 hypothetical protein JMJ76_0010441 [Colletotrichum scovillei]KAG7081293.1 hypothetical protein JMJ78_0003417 [Colletotrichum scovillei]
MVNIICLLPGIHPDGPSHEATCAVPQSSLTPEPHLARAGQAFSIEFCLRDVDLRGQFCHQTSVK